MFNRSVKSLQNRLTPTASYPFQIRHIRVGSAIRFDIRDIELYLQEIEQEAAEGA